MSREDLRSVLDAALPTPPESMLRPPLTAIRGRIRRRRIRHLATAAGAVAAVVAVLLWAPLLARVNGQGQAPVPAASAPTSAPSTEPTVQWPGAALDRDGRTVTVQISAARADASAHPDDSCQEIATTGVEQRPDRVVITVYVRYPGSNECLISDNLSAVIRLDAPLGTRKLVDGSQGQQRPVLSMTELPLAPAGYTIEHGAVDDGNRWGWGYQPGQESLSHIGVGAERDPVPVTGKLVETVQVQGRVIDIHLADGRNEYGLPEYFAVWRSSGWQFLLSARPSDRVLSLAEFRQLVEGLSWS